MPAHSEIKFPGWHSHFRPDFSGMAGERNYTLETFNANKSYGIIHGGAIMKENNGLESRFAWTYKGICPTCKHFHKGAHGCDAYPDEIPFAIIIGDFLHYKPYPLEDDHGILFEPKVK
jgi:hypothetical protein